jgi:hypothetical protein
MKNEDVLDVFLQIHHQRQAVETLDSNNVVSGKKKV